MDYELPKELTEGRGFVWLLGVDQLRAEFAQEGVPRHAWFTDGVGRKHFAKIPTSVLKELALESPVQERSKV
jgi:hypothetical protein